MSAKRLGREWLLAHLPHQGAMNLLHEIVSWDDDTLHAVATNHRDPAHPLRRRGELPIAAAIEYGAQAAAAHGALTSGDAGGAGVLAGLRAVSFHARNLDSDAKRLDVIAEQLGAGETGVLYRFEVRAGEEVLATGRIIVAAIRQG